MGINFITSFKEEVDELVAGMAPIIGAGLCIVLSTFKTNIELGAEASASPKKSAENKELLHVFPYPIRIISNAHLWEGP